MMENFTKRLMKIEDKIQKTLIMKIENENGNENGKWKWTMKCKVIIYNDNGE